nr:MAG TPA: tail tape measure protein [Caudoviricetes sp.]
MDTLADFSITGEVKLNSGPAEQSVNKWTVAAGNLIADFAKKAASALESVVKSGISYNAGMESYLTNFKVMLGDEQLAAEKLEEIRKMAASTPFTLSDLTDGTQTLLQFGIAADDTTGVLKQLGDISLGNADKLQTLVRAYGKMSSAQKVTLENVNMMIDAGFNPLNQICDATGESMSDLYKRISDGKVGFDELASAVNAATSEGGQFYNGMLEASQTVNGRLSTLQDNISALVGKLTEDLFTAFGDIIGKGNELVVTFLDDDEKMRQLKETIGIATAVVAAAGAAFLSYKGAVTATTVVTTAQTAATAALAAMHKAEESGVKGLAVAQAGLNAVMKANPIGLVVSLAAALVTGLVTAYNTSETFRNVVNHAFQSVANTAKSAIGGAIGWLDQLSYKLNHALGKDGYSSFNTYDDYKADKDAQKDAETSNANRDQRHKAAQSGEGISNKSWTERQNEAKAAAAESQKAAQTISTSAASAASATQNAAEKASFAATKAASEVVNSITSTGTKVENGVTTTTETVNETLKNGTQQQKQTVTETSRQMVNGVLSDVKTITTTAADGSQKVQQSIEAVRDVVSTTKDTQTQLIDGAKVTVEKTTELLADGSERISTVTTRTGKEIIDGVERTVKTVTTKTADGVESTVRTIEDAGPQYASAGELLTTQFRTKLEDGWAQIQSDIQTDALGAIKTLANAIKNGDIEQLGLWAAEYFWNACSSEQKKQINDLALGALNKLSSALGGVGSNLASLAASLVAKFIPAAASATAGQTALNVAMDANPILLVISLIGMLVGALVSFAGTNKSVGEGFKKVWYGVEDIASFVFESILRAIGLNVQGFVSAVNAIIDTYNWAASKLHLSTISRVSNPLWKAADKLAAQRRKRQAERKLQDEDAATATDSGSKKVIESLTDTRKETRQDGTTVTTKTLTEKLQDDAGRITTQVTKTITEAGKRLVDGVERSYKTITTYVDGVKQKTETILDDLDKSSSSGASSGTPAPDNTGAIEDNTAAILAANKTLAEMVRQADSLVLSDNMAVTRSVAASGTAQVAAAANNYHREGDTTIIQNIHSKAQSAADLARETRWEADRAKAQKH